MEESTYTLRRRIFSMLSDARLCDVLQGIDDAIERFTPDRSEVHQAALGEVRTHLELAIFAAEKVDLCITEL
jgi:hypothetical protein